MSQAAELKTLVERGIRNIDVTYTPVVNAGVINGLGGEGQFT